MRVLGSELFEILLQYGRRDILAVVVLHKCPREAEVALTNEEDGVFGRERNGGLEIPGMSFGIAAVGLGLWFSGLIILGGFLDLVLGLVRRWSALLFPRTDLAFLRHVVLVTDELVTAVVLATHE